MLFPDMALGILLAMCTVCQFTWHYRWKSQHTDGGQHTDAQNEATFGL